MLRAAMNELFIYRAEEAQSMEQFIQMPELNKSFYSMPLAIGRN